MSIDDLVYACHTGNYADVARLIELNVDVNGETEHGTPLITAAAYGYLDLVKILLLSDAHINVRDANGDTALVKAVENGHVEVVNELIANRARVHPESIIFAAKAEDINMTRSLLQITEFSDGFCILHYVATLTVADHGPELFAAIEFILKAGAATRINQRNDEGETALLLAAWGDNLPMVSLLCERGADVNLTDDRGMTPLMVASQPDPVTALLRTDAKDEINKTNNMGLTALMIAVSAGRPAVARVLLQAGADVTKSGIRGWTCLMIAAFNSTVSVVKLMLARGALAIIEDCDADNGETALMLAVQRGHPEIVAALLAAGASVKTISLQGYTVLMHACALENGDGDRDSDSEEDGDGEEGEEDQSNAMYTCVDVGAEGSTRRDTIVRLLLDAGAGAQLEVADLRGDTALLIAVRNREISVVKTLIAANADINTCNNEGATVLLEACSHSSPSTALVAMLIDSGAAVNASDVDGITPLFPAVSSGNETLVLMLLAAGADALACDSEGCTLLMEGQRARPQEAREGDEDLGDRMDCDGALVLLVTHILERGAGAGASLGRL